MIEHNPGELEPVEIEGFGSVSNGAPFLIVGVTTVTTENSVWTFTPSADPIGLGGTYVRMPKQEGPRAQTPSLGDRLHDEVDHRYIRAAWAINFHKEVSINLFTGGLPSGIERGIFTGVVLRVRTTGS
jgi:hypothetical protein